MSHREVGMQPLPTAPQKHLPGPSVLILGAKTSKLRPVSTGHRASALGVSHSSPPGSKPASTNPDKRVSKPGTGRAKPPASRPGKRPKPKAPPATTPAPTPAPSPAPTAGTIPAAAPPTREPAGSPPPTTPPTPPPVAPPPPVTPPPVDSRPGHGYGDDNHDHTGPPGQSKDGGHDDSNGDGGHGHSKDHGGDGSD